MPMERNRFSAKNQSL